MVFSAVLIYFIVFALKQIDSSPVIVDKTDIKDEWNAKITPHRVPLLPDSNKNHILPPKSEVIKENRNIQDEKDDKKLIRIPKKLGDAVRSRISCSVCKIGVGLLAKEVENNTTFEDIKTKFVHLCVAFKVENEKVCTGVFDVFGPVVIPVLQTIEIGPPEICSLVLGEICGDISIPTHDWDIKLPDIPKPDIIEPEVPQNGLPTFKVLQISDTHYDPEYAEGSPANCQDPLCCRVDSTPPETDTLIKAGKWGSYESCDSPKIIIENMFRHIAEVHPDIDYILWTGDLVPHDIWNQTKESNLNIIQATVELLFEIFPNTPVFPALGNHESIPAGNFAPPWMKNQDHSVNWLYAKIADHWRKWLPASSGNTILHGGFYSVLIRPGFRIISLNTNYCHTLSWWLLLNSTDPARELEWFINELQEAENKGEKVHIIGHIAPGSSDCMKVWSAHFYSIVERYENTIQGQFYGHSHADEFKVFYDVDESSKPIKRFRFIRRKDKNYKFTGRATSVAYLAPSVTTYDNFNPAYRIYYIDGDHQNTTREVIDHETWTTDLEEANLKGEPKWYRLYSARNAYGLPSLRAKEWAKLIENLVDDPTLFDKFYKFYYRDSPTQPSCDNQCKLQTLCDLKSGRSHFRHQICHDLELVFGT